MKRYTLLLLAMLVGGLVATACKDSGTDTEPPEPAPVEPQVSVNNPPDGAMLEGEVTFAIDGESENGFDEARIYLGRQLIKTVSRPGLPYEQTIKTYDYDNGDYDLRAELDASGMDTTVKASASVTLENYLVHLETDGYVSRLNDIHDAAYIYIANPEGRVLRTLDLSVQMDGTFNLLPPSVFNGAAPEQFSITVGYKTVPPSSSNRPTTLDFTTVTGIKSWTSSLGKKFNSPSGGSTKKLNIHMANIPYRASLGVIQGGQSNTVFGREPTTPENEVDFTANVENNTQEAMLVAYPDVRSEGNKAPYYHLEKNVQDSLNGPATLRYDSVSADFKKMRFHDVDLPPNTSLAFYDTFMSRQSGSFNTDSYYFFRNFIGDLIDGNTSNSTAGMIVPNESGRQYGYYMELFDDAGDANYYHQAAGSSLPNTFDKLDAAISINDDNPDHVKLSVSGSGDVLDLRAIVVNGNNSITNNWHVFAPDTSTNIVFPKLADSVGTQMSGLYHRSQMQVYNTEMIEFEEMQDYNDFINSRYNPNTSVSEFYFHSKIQFNASFSGKASMQRKLGASGRLRGQGGSRNVRHNHGENNLILKR